MFNKDNMCGDGETIVSGEKHISPSDHNHRQKHDNEVSQWRTVLFSL